MIAWTTENELFADETEARRLAKLRGERFVDQLRQRFFDRPSDHPQADVVEVIGDWYIQRHRGKVVGGAHAPNGVRRMVAGGKVVGSPVSARPIYEAMNARGVQPSKTLSPYGRDAQRRHADA